MAVQIGLKGLVYALLTEDLIADGATAGKTTYSAPVSIPGVISATINPNATIETLFADDGPMETATALGKIDVEIVVGDMTNTIQSVLLGHTITAGVLHRKAGDVPPWVAIGFKSVKSNGKYRFVWLLKGKFSIPEMKNDTKSDKITWVNPTIKGAFAKRDSDDEWIKQADEDDEEFVSASTFLTAVEATV